MKRQYKFPSTETQRICFIQNVLTGSGETDDVNNRSIQGQANLAPKMP